MINEKVENFLRDLELIDSEKFDIVQNIRREIRDLIPDIDEKIMYGGIVFTINSKDIGGIFARKHHISFEFTSGYLMQDKNGILEGTGQFRRHIKLKKKSDILEKDLLFFLKQMK